MTNVYSYFGIQDVHDLADRILKGDANDLGSRATMCTRTAQTVQSMADEVQRLSDEMFRSWTGVGADAAKAKMATVVQDRRRQADQLTKSAGAFTASDLALVDAQRQARDIVAQAEAAGHALDGALRAVQTAMNAMTGGGVLEWGVKKLTGVDLEAESRKLLLAAVRPIYEEALGLLARMERVIRDYEQVLLDQAAVLRGMPGIVRTDAGPVDLPGDADLRRGALFTSVYGHPPETANDKLMAEALDLQGDDTANKDPNARVIVTHITPVPGAGIVHGSAFIAAHEVFDPRLGSVNDKGDGRGFDANADPSKSRASFYVDYEKGIVVVRQNASHADNGESAVGDPSVGVEQDPQGRVRLRLDASNPLAPPLFQDAKVSVRGDLVIDPHGGSGPAGVNGAVTRFPSWEVYQNHDGRTGEPVFQRHEDDVTRTLGRPFPPYSANTGPAEGLPQPTVPVGQDPQVLDNWRKQFHPGQGNGTGHDLPRDVPELLGDDFYRYGLPNVPYPSVDGTGRVAVPVAGKAG